MAESSKKLIGLLLAAYRDPLRYQQRLKGSLPEPFQKVLQLAAGKMPEEIQSLCARWNSNPEELRKAAIFYVEQSCLHDEESPYRILGLNPGADRRKIRAHYHLLMGLLHPDRAEASQSWRDAYVVRVNAAYHKLRWSDGHQAHGGETQVAKAKNKNRAPVHSRQRGPKQNFLLYLVQRFPRSIRYLPHFILGSGMVITLTLMANLYLLHTREDGAKAPLPPEENVSSLKIASMKPEESPTRPVPESPPSRWEEEVAPFARQADEEKVKADLKENQPLKKQGDAGPPEAPDPSLAAPQARIEKKPLSILSREQAPTAAPSPPDSPSLASDKAFSPGPVKTARQAQPEAPPPLPATLQPSTPPRESRPGPSLKEKDFAEKKKKMAFSGLPGAAPNSESREERAGRPHEPAPLAASSEIKRQALNRLIEHFVTAYQQGNLDKFLRLFSGDASTNDYRGKAALRQDYTRFFSSTQRRELRLQSLQWRIKGDRAQGKGRYIVQIAKASGTFEGKGQIRFQVQNQRGAPLITGLFNTVDSGLQ
ncbi:Heat shock protein DnaJ [Nitrosococcus oceani ATCC 19707]|uniref:Heat shock protein DnaJ n=2 Tax=Nitrosococcus oceani TaxID=1229 RepID=Q3JB12_NITOC|nr:DnaJ domain-containing protein [Nitrosococcus oceani]ABA57984.1 Heat shock protein DnaJ [Nitrosococcus oceani ATCC 19707]EDZ68518.1 DnaJ domain protein [Nitrosococcus oceani AFC27]KFI19583.1 molecular chaperone DnaJ [Nitrosococcus oceani C-27]GEM19631.1 molecular chaperone DnaJ [Nitrosococcus oceani]